MLNNIITVFNGCLRGTSFIRAKYMRFAVKEQKTKMKSTTNYSKYRSRINAKITPI